MVRFKLDLSLRSQKTKLKISLMKITFAHLAPLSILGLALACTDPASDDGETTVADTGDMDDESDATIEDGETETSTEAGETAETETTGETGGEACGELPCEDALILDLSLQDSVAEGEVNSTQDGEDWVSVVDATAGGSMAAASNPWIYLRMTPEGLEKVAIDDYAAMESTAWQFAAKRYGIRVNSGTSGPGCVRVAAVDGSYAELSAAPDSAEYAAEDFYDDSCTLVDDSLGLGDPNYLLADWWGYAGCVTTTGQVFLVELDDGTVAKLTIEAYYGEGQEGCNTMGTMGSESAMLTWRWRLL